MDAAGKMAKLNLDAMSDTELAAYSAAHPRSRLGKYAREALEARAKRLAGEIMDACEIEDYMELIYDRLPKRQRW